MTAANKSLWALIITILLWLAYAITSRAEDTAIRATITRVSLQQPDALQVMKQQIQALTDEGFEYSWNEPNAERGFVWVKYGPMPWVKVRAHLSVEECETVRRLLKI